MSRISDKEAALVALFTGLTGVKSVEIYRGQLVNLKPEALYRKLPGVFIWWEGTDPDRVGQKSSIKRDEFNALVVTQRPGKKDKRQTDAYTIAEEIEGKIEAQAWEYLETEALVNDGTVAILAVKFLVGEAY